MELNSLAFIKSLVDRQRHLHGGIPASRDFNCARCGRDRTTLGVTLDGYFFCGDCYHEATQTTNKMVDPMMHIPDPYEYNKPDWGWVYGTKEQGAYLSAMFNPTVALLMILGEWVFGGHHHHIQWMLLVYVVWAFLMFLLAFRRPVEAPTEETPNLDIQVTPGSGYRDSSFQVTATKKVWKLAPRAKRMIPLLVFAHLLGIVGVVWAYQVGASMIHAMTLFIAFFGTGILCLLRDGYWMTVPVGPETSKGSWYLDPWAYKFLAFFIVIPIGSHIRTLILGLPHTWKGTLLYFGIFWGATLPLTLWNGLHRKPLDRAPTRG